MKIPYTYQVYKINLEQGHFEVKYTPQDTSLIAITSNVPAFFPKDDGTPRTVEEIVEYFAPYMQWQGQKTILEQGDSLLNASGTGGT